MRAPGHHRSDGMPLRVADLASISDARMYTDPVTTRSLVPGHLRRDPVSAQTEMRPVSGIEMPVEAGGAGSCATQASGSGIGLVWSLRRGPNGPIPDRSPGRSPGSTAKTGKRGLEPECKLHRCACSKQRHNGQA